MNEFMINKKKGSKVFHKRNYQDKSKFYVTNDDLYAELTKYHNSEVDKETGKHIISEELGKMLYTIAKHLTYHWSFKNYPQYLKEEMIGSACLKMIKYIDAYDLDRKPANPFSYFTQVCYNAFLGPINDYYKQKNLKRDLTVNHINEIQTSKFSTIKSTYMAQIQKTLEEFLNQLKKEDKIVEESGDDDESDITEQD